MKPFPNRFLIPVAAALVIHTSTRGADLVWDGAVNSNWNTATANWTGSTWNSGTPDNAFFNTSTGAITLTEAINAGNVTFGLGNANTSGSFSGSSLAVSGDLLAQADGNNGPGGPTLSFSNNVSVTGDLRIARRVLEITGGTFTANRVLSAGSWGRLLISGGTVSVVNGIDDSINGGNTMSVVLFGGSLYTSYIKTTSAGFTGLPNDGVILSGGTLFATANSNDFIQTWDPGWGNRNNIGVGAGGTVINTNGFDITITKSMQDWAGAGVITKSGAGTLTLTNANTYSGGTTVNTGTLLLSGAGGGYSRVAGPLTVNSGASVGFANDDGTGLGWIDNYKVTSLTINGGTVSSPGTIHIWNFAGGVNMTGGTLASNNGVSDQNGAQLEWINADVTTNASADAATIAGRIRMRADGGVTGINFNVADGAAAADLLVSAAITQASGGMGITKNGAGTMRLTGYNTYNGATTINGGRLEVHGATGGWGIIRGSVTVNAGGTLAITGGDGTGFGWNSPVTSLAINGGTFDSAGGSHVGFGSYMTVALNNGGTITGNGQWNGDSMLGFSSSGDSTNTINGAWTLRSDGGVNHTFNVANGASAVDLQVNASLSDQYPEVDWLPSSALIKTGAGTMVLAGNNSYNGNTIVSAGTLLVTGAFGDSAVSVGTDATIGGSGTIGGTLSFSVDSFFDVFSAIVGNDPLAVAGTVSFGSGFGIDNLAGINWASVAPGTYTLIDSTQDFSLAGLDNWGIANAISVGSGKSAYFANGSLQLVVIPEPRAALLGGLGMLALLRRRR